MNNIALPDKLSDLIDMALDDAERIFDEEDESWFMPDGTAWLCVHDKGCRACLAGMIMFRHRRDKVKSAEDMIYGHKAPAYDSSLGALEAVRLGNWVAAAKAVSKGEDLNEDQLELLYSLGEPSNPRFRGWKQYWVFAKEVRLGAKLLREVGL